MSLSHFHRASAEVMRAVIFNHTTMSSFLAEPLGGVRRWQSACPVAPQAVCMH